MPKQSKQKKTRNVGSAPGERGVIGLRVIGGSLRGSKLTYAGDNRVRPMKDRVREAVFNLIGPTVRGMHAIDLFCGTGALAIEAISRGAASATLIDCHLPTLKNARQNVESLQLKEKCQLEMADAFFWANRLERLPRDRAWLVFCSPPYELFLSHAESMQTMLAQLAAAAPAESLIIIEADARFDFASLPFTIADKKRRSYPPAEIAIFVKET